MINFKKVSKTLDIYKSQFESQKANHSRLSKHISQNPKDIDAVRNKMLLEGRMFYVNHNINLLTSRAKIVINN